MGRSIDIIELELALTNERLDELSVEKDILVRREDLLALRAEDLAAELEVAKLPKFVGEDEE
jgi:hypothetical protein